MSFCILQLMLRSIEISFFSVACIMIFYSVVYLISIWVSSGMISVLCHLQNFHIWSSLVAYRWQIIFVYKKENRPKDEPLWDSILHLRDFSCITCIYLQILKLLCCSGSFERQLFKPAYCLTCNAYFASSLLCEIFQFNQLKASLKGSLISKP